VRNLCSFATCVALAALVGSSTIDAQQSAPQKPEDFLERQLARQEKEREEALARARKQEEQDRETERMFRRVVPLDVQVVISRYQGDKRVSSLPYSLVVNAVFRGASEQLAQIRMGAQVPLPTTAAPTVDGKPVTGLLTANPVQYKEIGTFVDAHANWLEDNTYQLHVSVSDISLYRRPQGTQPPTGEPIDDVGLPVLRTFTAANNMVLRDGQTKQFMLASDRISGDTLRVDVTLKVSK
jgi:hypothetical protein